MYSVSQEIVATKLPPDLADITPILKKRQFNKRAKNYRPLKIIINSKLATSLCCVSKMLETVRE